MNVSFHEDNKIGTITFDQPDSKVNVLNSQTIQEFDDLLTEIAKNSELDALIIRSAKDNCFVAGADIKEIQGIVELEDGRIKAKAGQDVFNKIEDLPIPTIALIDGLALGGGCELILGCQYRLATFNEKIKIGLPEVNLGFIPGFGGTYRLPRTVGLQQGLTMILTGQMVDTNKALRIGLVDKLIPQASMEKELLQFVEAILKKGGRDPKYRPRQLRGINKFLEKTTLGRSIVFKQARKNVLSKTKGFYPAPLKAIDVVERNLTKGRDRGLDLEARTFANLAITDISKNLVHFFQISEKFRKLKVNVPANTKPIKIEKVGVIGAGVMGGGIAQLLSYKGITTRLKDINHDALALGLKSAAKVFQGAMKRRKIKPHDMRNMMARITTTLDYSGFDSTDMVIEAVVENMDIKKAVFKDTDAAVNKDTIIATNTSSLSVAEMASAVSDPSKVIGFHFFNPVHRMPLIEIITTDQTSSKTLLSSVEFAKSLGKTPIVVKDSCGFLVNRILLGYVNEAGRLLEEGIAMEDLDRVACDFGMPMGPITLSDEVGLDVGIKVLKILQDAFGERFKPVDVFEKVYEKKMLGKKSGKGFYLHGKKRTPNPEINRLIKGHVVGFDEQETIDRVIYIMVNEAARCIEEGVVDDAAAVDVGMVMGTGFPPFRGGLLRYADEIGAAKVVTRMLDFESRFKDGRFAPCDYLKNLADQQGKFYK